MLNKNQLNRLVLICFTFFLFSLFNKFWLKFFSKDVQNNAIKAENLQQNQTNKQKLLNNSLPLAPEIQQLIQEKNIVQPPRGDVRLLIISDLNSAYGSTEYEAEVHLALDLIPFWQPDLVLSSGDMIAGQKPSLTARQIRAMWQAFEQQIAQPLRDLNIPFGFTMGNHDASSAVSFEQDKYLFQQERDLAVEYWHNPQHHPGLKFIDRQQFPFYYTFTHKNIFFLVWDGSSSYIPPDKLAWVEKSLASPLAQQATMRIVIGHLPLYAVAVGRDFPGEVLDKADELRTMLEKYDVHTYISGHHHAYYPAHKGSLQLLHTGALGSGPRPLIAGKAKPIKTLTVVDVNFDDSELTSYSTYNMETLELINYQQLPRLLMGHNGIILRRDLEMPDLTSGEKDACFQEFGEKYCSSN
jgi:hypothetical protein